MGVVLGTRSDAVSEPGRDYGCGFRDDVSKL